MISNIFVLIIMLCAGYIDLKKRVIPNEIILIIYLFAIFGSNAAIIERIAGFLIPAFPLFLIALFNRNIKGGDIKYLSAIGAYFGLSGLVVILSVATIVALIWYGIKKAKSVPLATVTAIGSLVYYIINYF